MTQATQAPAQVTRSIVRGGLDGYVVLNAKGGILFESLVHLAAVRWVRQEAERGRWVTTLYDHCAPRGIPVPFDIDGPAYTATRSYQGASGLPREV